MHGDMPRRTHRLFHVKSSKSLQNTLYPLSTLPEHIHSTILSYCQNYLKTHTQTMETDFHPPLTLVSLLANYPHSHYLPPHWGTHLHTHLYSHSIFWRHGSIISRAVSCTFVLCSPLFWFQSYRCLSCLFLRGIT